MCKCLTTCTALKGMVLLGLPHNACSLTMSVASRDIYTDISEGPFLLQLPHESQLMASAGSSSSLTSQVSILSLPPSLCI